MAGWGDDLEAEYDNVREAVKKLQAKDPKHPLLRFFILPVEDRDPDGKPKDPEKEKAVQIEMKNRFWRRPEPWQKQPGVMVCTIVYCNYCEALERAIAGKEGDFEAPPADRKPSCPGPMPGWNGGVEPMGTS